jgi:hypothetical protein
MSTTDETTETSGGGKPPAKKSGTGRALKRYGPIVLVVVLIAAAVAIFGGGGDDNKDNASSETGSSSEEELIRSGPMTPAKAELEGKTDIDWGPNCDTKTGRIKLKSVYAPPCVEPFTGDNGGATSPGVTADSVKIVF